MSRNRLGFVATVLVAVGLALPAIPAFAADDWVNVATISPTTTLVPQAICYTDGRDIACDSSAGLRIAGGGIAVSGTVSATHFVGDGSGLTGLPAGNLSETIAINDLSDASASVVKKSVFLGSGSGNSSTGNENTAVGINALASNTTGGGNVANGSYALYNNTTGSTNVANGSYALYRNSTGGGNVANGYYALYNTTSGGGSNTANGAYALFSNTTGSSNMANGNRALYYNTVGVFNVANGASSLFNNTTGNNNVADGYYALYGNTTGSDNVANGYRALVNANPVTNTVAIGGNAAAGTGGTGFANGTFVGYASGQAITTGNDNTFLGAWAGATTTTGSSNTLIGALAYTPDPATSNYLNIANAISGSTLSGGSMTFIGGIKANGIVTATYFEGDGSHLTGLASTNLSETIAINDLKDASASTVNGSLYMGNNAGLNGNTAATGNTAVGISALSGLGIGNTSNTAVGYQAMIDAPGSYANTTVGTQSLANIGEGPGHDNVVMGYRALFNAENASYNVALGSLVGGALLDGSNNILVGYSVGVPNGAVSNYRLNIGNSIFGDMTNANALGGASKIGINYITPSVALEVSGTVSATHFVGDGSGLTGMASTNLSETIAINDLSDASASAVINSLFLGAGNGAVNTGTYNTGVGIAALASNTTGGSNTGLGALALKSSSTGSQNTAVGVRALYLNTTGFGNTAVGMRALDQNTTGGYNTAQGVGALLSNQTGSGNTGLGYSALGNVTTANSNTAVGYYAGYATSTGVYNLLMGYAVNAPTATSNYALNIGNSIFGDMTNAAAGVGGASKIGINYVTPSVALEVSGTVSATHFVGDGSGLTGIATGVPSEITSGTTKVSTNSNGYISLTTGGATTGYFDTVGALTLPGVSATGTVSADMITVRGVPLNVSGADNIALGTGALVRTTGTSNFAGGTNAMNLLNTGSYNVGLGVGAMSQATTASYTVAMGASSGRMTVGAGGVFIGYNSGFNSRIGDYNTYIGYNTGRGSTAGGPYTNNTIVGAGSGFSSNGGSNNIMLGAGLSLANGDNQLTIGDLIFGDMTGALSGGKAGKVGINVAAPSVALEVSGTVSATALYVNGVAVTGGGTNLSETIAINDLSDASASTAVNSIYLGSGAGVSSTGGYNIGVGIQALSKSTSGGYNTATGYRALYNTTTGYQNVAYGFASLFSNVTNSQNVAYGSYALYNNTADQNAAVGDYSLYYNTTGTFNSALGANALFNNTTGSYNAADGGNAMFTNTTGSYSAGSGFGALYSNTTGSMNSGFGFKSQYTNTTGGNNVSLGYSANFYGNPVVNSVVVGANAGLGVSGSTAYTNGTFLGYASGQGITTGGNNTFLGAYSGLTTTTGGSNIALGYNVKLPTATTSSGLNIGNSIFGDMTNAAASVGGASKIGINMVTPTASLEVSGTVSATALYVNGVAVTGGGTNLSETIAINDLKDASASTVKSSVYLGNGSGGGASGSYDTGLGYSALAVNAGDYNTAVGYSALSLNTTGSHNIGVGYRALFKNTTGTHNIAIGSDALYFTTTGLDNFAGGYTALTNNVTGSYNVGIGEAALSGSTNGSYNTALGVSTLQNADPVTNSVAIGYLAGQGGGTSTYSNNTFIGGQSGKAVTTGGNNTFLGAYAGDATTTGGSNIIIGYNTDAPSAGASSTLNIGNAISGSLTGSMTFIGGIKANGIVTATYFEGDGSHLINVGATTFASLTDVSYSATYAYIFGPGSLTGAHSAAMHTTAFGDSALSNAGNVGTGNSAFGRRVLYSNTTGSNNTGVGAFALNNNSTGTRNTALGTYALAYNALGGANIAIGYYALTSSTGNNTVQVTDTVAIGYYAGQSMVNSERNVLIGSYAGNLTNGSSNTFVGYNAAAGITTGASNISLGAGTSPYSNTGSWQLNIGNAIWGNIGSGMSNANLIGINVTTPTVALQVSGTVSATRFVGDGSGLTGIASGSPNEIVSGTTKVSTNSNGYISLTTGGVTTGYLDTTGRLIVPSISVTSLSGISVTSATFSGSIGVGTATPGFLPANSVYTKGDLYSDNYVRGWEFGVVNNGGLRWGDWTTYVTGTGGSNIDMAIANQLALRVLPSGRVAIGGLTTTTVSLGVSGTIRSTNYEATATSYGVYGSAVSTNGYGVYGYTNAATGNTSGVGGETASTSGRGVYGVATASTGVTYGVYGQVSSPDGYGVYSNGNSYVSGSLTVSGTISTTALYVNGVAITGGGAANLSETIAINDLKDASASTVVNSLYMGTGAGGSSAASYNTIVGIGAMNLSSTGGNNTAMGYSALRNNTTGTSNAAYGYQSLYGNTTGTNNTAYGYMSLPSNDAGSFNTAIGNQALYTAVSATYNTALGSQALRATTTGGSNVAAGAMALYSNTTGQSNVAVGGAALYTNTTGSYNSAIGTNALYANTTGSSNVATGYQTLASNDTGGNNVASGFYAMNANSAGSNNTATGSAALQNNSTGSFNVANGAGALFYANPITGTVAIGNSAGFGVSGQTTFSNGVFVGIASGQAITTGGNNTFLGAYAGDSVTTGGSNIIIGYNADAPTATSSNTLNIGNAISGSMASGGSMTFIGGIKANGIVTATYFEGDGSRLTGIGGGGGGSEITSGTTKVSTNSNGYISLTTGGVTTGYFDTAGKLIVPGVGIGVVNLATALEVSGTVSASSVSGIGVRGSSSSGTGVQGMATATSGVTYGGYFSTASNQGFGVYATATSATGTTYGVYGQAASSNGFGVYGSGATGVYGSGSGTGVSGYTSGAGYAVYGNAPNDLASGGYFESAGNNGFGVRGMATNTGSGGTGVIGQTAANAGYGVRGVASAVSGTNYGVFGQAASPNGYAVYAYGNAYVRSSLTVSDTISTSALYVNGVAITGGGGGGSEITSGTTKVSTNSNGYISLTTGGVTTGYFDTTGKLVLPRLTATGLINSQSTTVVTGGYGMYGSSGLNLGGGGSSPNMASIGWGDGTGWKLNLGSYPSFVFTPKFTFVDTGKMGIGTQTPTVALEVVGTVSATQFVGDGSLLTGISGSGSQISSGTTKVSTNSNGYISLTTGGVTTGYFDTVGQLTVPGVGIGGAAGTQQAAALYVSQTSVNNSGAAAYVVGLNNTNSMTNGGHGLLNLVNADNTSSAYGGIIFSAFDDTNVIRHGAGIAMGKDGTWSGNTFPGYLAFWTRASGVGGTEYERMRIDNAGNVGLGTAVPLSTLHVSSSTAGMILEGNSGVMSYVSLTYSPRISLIDTISGTVTTQPVWALDNSRDAFRIFRQPTLTTGGTVAVYINSATQVGIGKQTVGYKLDVNGQVAGAGAYVNTSDARLKKDVTPIAYGLDTIMKLRPVGFNWIDQAEAWKKQHQLGLIAQEVEGVIPEVVSAANDASQTRSLAYGELVPVLIKAVQDLKGENMELQTQNDQLKADMKAMQDMLKQQNQRLDGLEKRTLH
jgi:hypothetical protein